MRPNIENMDVSHSVRQGVIFIDFVKAMFTKSKCQGLGEKCKYMYLAKVYVDFWTQLYKTLRACNIRVADHGWKERLQSKTSLAVCGTPEAGSTAEYLTGALLDVFGPVTQTYLICTFRQDYFDLQTSKTGWILVFVSVSKYSIIYEWMRVAKDGIKAAFHLCAVMQSWTNPTGFAEEKMVFCYTTVSGCLAQLLTFKFHVLILIILTPILKLTFSFCVLCVSLSDDLIDLW